MRILFVTPYYRPAYVYGGPARSLPTLCEALARLGVEVAVYTTNANGKENFSESTFSEVIAGVTVTYFQRFVRPFGRFFYAPELGRKCRSEMHGYHLAYLCGTWTYPTIPARIAAVESGVPYVLSPRGTLMEWCLRQKMLKKKLYMNVIEKKNINHAAVVHCTSDIEREQVSALGFLPEAVMIPNGVDISAYAASEAPGRVRSRYGIPHSALLSLFVGRLQKEKRVARMIQAFSQVTRRIPESHLLIVGPDEDEVGVLARTLVKDLSLENRVHFAGQVPAGLLPDFYADADMQILISHTENFGMAAVEAMASSLPVLVSSEVGIAAEIARWGAGVIVDAESSDCEHAWEDLLQSSEKRHRMGKCGLALVDAMFSSDAVARNMLALFQSLVAKTCEGHVLVDQAGDTMT